jgi:hypothetical protein
MTNILAQAFELFTPHELQLIVCGSPNLDFLELEKGIAFANTLFLVFGFGFSFSFDFGFFGFWFRFQFWVRF